MNQTIECPLCLGQGTLTRTEVLDGPGIRDVARVAQPSAEEASSVPLRQSSVNKNRTHRVGLRHGQE